MNGTPPVLAVHGAAKVWSDGQRHVDIEISDLVLRPGEVKVITGPSGSGKSTALDMLALALQPDRVSNMRLWQDGAETDIAALHAKGAPGADRAAWGSVFLCGSNR